MSKGNKYTMSSADYLKMLLYNIENIDKEKQLEYIKDAYIKYEMYKREKEYYDSLSEEERLKVEIIDFEANLKKKSNEIKKLQYLLQYGKSTKKSPLNDNEIDVEYEKTEFILFEFSEKFKLYKKLLEEKSNSKIFDPPLMQNEINNFTFRMIINEYSRLNQNIINYNFFMKTLVSFYKLGVNEKIEDQNVIKTSILMFLLDCDYEKNTDIYEQYNFSNISVKYRENKYQNGNDDIMTIKAKTKRIAKMLRDAASHGEFYPEDQRNNLMHLNYKIEDNDLILPSSTIRIENSEVIPRIGFNMSYETLNKFVMENLSEEIKNKYSFLIKIVESKNIEDVIYSTDGLTKDSIKEIMILMLHNIVQYNTEHHFKDLQMEDKIDVSKFSFYNLLMGEVDITSDLPQLKKIMNVKNALGHDNVNWSGDNLELINDWTPARGRAVKNKAVISFNDLIFMFIQHNLYNVSTISQGEYDMYYKKSNSIK